MVPCPVAVPPALSNDKLKIALMNENDASKPLELLVVIVSI